MRQLASDPLTAVGPELDVVALELAYGSTRVRRTYTREQAEELWQAVLHAQAEVWPDLQAREASIVNFT